MPGVTLGANQLALRAINTKHKAIPMNTVAQNDSSKRR
jgi:hypothetical protein